MAHVTILATRWAELALCLLVVGSVFMRPWRTQQRGMAWVVALFGDIGLILAVSSWAPGDTASTFYWWYVKVLLGILLLVPYMLFRFTDALKRASAPARRVAAGATLGIIAWTFALPRLTVATAARPLWEVLWEYGLLVAWGLVSIIAAWRLWSAGARQPTVVRRRMRLLASSAMVIVAELVVSVAKPSVPGSGEQAAIGLIGFVAIVGFVLAFNLPRPLRVLWRLIEEEAVTTSQSDLIAAMTSDDVARITPNLVARVIGGEAGMLADPVAAPVATPGMTADDLQAAAEVGAAASRAVSDGAPRSSQVALTASGLVVVPMSRGAWLAARPSPFTPFFGPEERQVLFRAAAYADIALDRARLYKQEQDSRKALAVAKEELDALLYGMSHDLKAPLVSIVGYIECLRSEEIGKLAEGSPGAHYMARIESNLSYMQSLIQDLLEVSRVGRSSEDVEPVALVDLLQEVVEDLARESSGAVVESGGHMPEIRMNKMRARQLFTNLLDNAVRYGPEGSVRVKVDASSRGDGAAVVTVADNGPGIPAPYRERVFGIFERLGDDRSRGSGTGIGLTVCRRIMESLQGSIQIVDGAGGVGACFALTFPPGIVVAWQQRQRQVVNS